MDYWHSIYAANMEAFFTVLSSLTEAVSVGNTHSAAAPSSLSTSSNSTTHAPTLDTLPARRHIPSVQQPLPGLPVQAPVGEVIYVRSCSAIDI